MKFCSYCGRMLNDGEVCNCRNINNENPANPAAPEVSNINPAQNVTPAYNQAGINPAETGQAGYNTAGINPAGYDPAGTNHVDYGYTVNPAVNAPQAPKKKSFFKSKFFIGIASGVAVAAIAAAIVLIVLSSSPQAKVYKAFSKTFKDSGKLAEDLSKFNFDSSDMTLKLSGSYEDYSIETYFTMDGKDKGVSAKLLEGKSTLIEANAVLDDKSVKVSLPESGYKKVLVYDYTIDEDEVDEVADTLDMRSRELNEINTALKAAYDASMGDSSIVKDMKSIFKDWAKELKYEKAETETFEIDGDDRDCSGYDIIITGDNAVSLIEKLYNYAQENYYETFENYDWDDIETGVERIEEQIEDMDDVVISVYLYDGEVAAIIIGEGSQKLTVEFNGGDYRMQNVVAYMGKRSSGEFFRIKGSRTDSKETVSIIISREARIDYKYYFESGKLEISAYEDADDDRELFSFTCTIETTSSSIAVTMGKISYNRGRTEIDLEDYNLRVEFSSKSSMPSVKGTELNIVGMDEDDLKDEVSDIEDALKDSLYDSDLLKMIRNVERYF
ncbi:MAG: hypothetical protein K6G45_00175 [Lachnospiraceae bacterium]|nr:hypothetical protein [Lachnospiraceae bacterium]